MQKKGTGCLYPTDLAQSLLEGLRDFQWTKTLLTDKLGLANVLTLSNEIIMCSR